eukprot:SAG31_NODE_2478_length_5637_cov_2.220657_4_plen_116_part_00
MTPTLHDNYRWKRLFLGLGIGKQTHLLLRFMPANKIVHRRVNAPSQLLQLQHRANCLRGTVLFFRGGGGGGVGRGGQQQAMIMHTEPTNDRHASASKDIHDQIIFFNFFSSVDTQ